MAQLINTIGFHGRRRLPKGKLEHHIVLTGNQQRSELLQEGVVLLFFRAMTLWVSCQRQNEKRKDVFLPGRGLISPSCFCGLDTPCIPRCVLSRGVNETDSILRWRYFYQRYPVRQSQPPSCRRDEARYAGHWRFWVNTTYYK